MACLRDRIQHIQCLPDRAVACLAHGNPPDVSASHAETVDTLSGVLHVFNYRN
jgi:hypothetical protein